MVDSAMVDGITHLLAATYSMLGSGAWNDERGTNLLDGASPFYTVYETSDGEWIAVGALESKFFTELLRCLGIGPETFDPSSQYDEGQWPRFRALLARVFRTRTRDAWAEHFVGIDPCVTPVLSLREGIAHPHIVARQSVVVDGPRIGPGRAPRFADFGLTAPGASPLPGQHTREVLAEIGVLRTRDEQWSETVNSVRP